MRGLGIWDWGFTGRLRSGWAALSLIVFAATRCTNAGEDRLLSISATGTVKGILYFDLNGNNQPDFGDDSLPDLRVRLVADRGTDTAATITTLRDGSFRFTSVPVGSYRIVVDTSRFADTLRVTHIDSARVTVLPGDSVAVSVAVTYPTVSVAAARALPVGRRVFLVGVGLNPWTSFSDSVAHLADSSGAIRLTRLRTGVFPTDSVRVRGTTARRSGQPTLDDVRSFFIDRGLVPAPVELTTAQASNASGGSRDAAFVLVRGVTVSDTASVVDDVRLTVSDGSGSLEVLLDHRAEDGFKSPVSQDYAPGKRFDIVGLLTPTGTGLWRLKPRFTSDLQKL